MGKKKKNKKQGQGEAKTAAKQLKKQVMVLSVRVHVLR
jgi:hypothetical protein